MDKENRKQTTTNIIILQKISPQKISRAKELRKNMTSSEKRLWEQLRGNRLKGYHFRRQQVIGEYIVDFYCHKLSLIFEVDGDIHQNQQDYDHDFLYKDHVRSSPPSRFGKGSGRLGHQVKNIFNLNLKIYNSPFSLRKDG